MYFSQIVKYQMQNVYLRLFCSFIHIRNKNMKLVIIIIKYFIYVKVYW